MLSDLNLNTIKNSEAIVLWSGGLDSTGVIPFIIEEYGVTVFPLFMNRGQLNYDGERRSIEYFSSLFSSKYEGKFNKYFEVNAPIPPVEFKNHFSHASIGKLYAMRNSDIANQGVRYALLLGIDTVLVGCQASDVFTDQTKKYWKIKTEEVRIGTGHKTFMIIAPFVWLGLQKEDIIRWCIDKNINIYESWSCWDATDRHCGICQACITRKQAFRKARKDDITKYKA